MPNFLIVLFLVLFALPGFSQEEHDGGGGKVIIRETPGYQAAEPEAIPIPDEDQEMIDAAEADRLKQIEKIQAVQKATAPIAEAKGPLQQIQELGYKQLDAAALMDTKVIALLQQNLRDGAMAKTSDEDLKKLMQEKIKGTWMEGPVSHFPKLLSIMSDLVRSKEALPGLLGIMARKADLKTYGYIWVVIFIFGLYIKSKLVKPKWDFGRRFKWKITISTILGIINFAIFYSFFGTEIQPSFSIIGKHLF
jgi:hypothetical protein